MSQKTATITVRIENKKPVELIDFTKALLAVGDQFRRDMEARIEDEVEFKLYVKELRQGSLVAELVPLAIGTVGVAMENAQAAITFIENARGIVHWLLSRSEKPDKVDAATLKNAISMVEPVAKDNGAIISITIQGSNHAPININTVEANAIQNRAHIYLESLKEPALDLRTKQLMYWNQVRNEDGPATGEKAIIESISERPVKVIFDTRELRDEMLYGKENPLKEAYAVDVEVQTVRGRIAAYKVLQLHDRIPLEDPKS